MNATLSLIDLAGAVALLIWGVYMVQTGVTRAFPVIALENHGRVRVPALAALATWRDLDAGTGPILAGALLPLVPHPALYGDAALLLAASATAVARVRKRGAA